MGDVCDNCPATVNPGQEDSEADCIGDLCDPIVVNAFLTLTNVSTSLGLPTPWCPSPAGMYTISVSWLNGSESTSVPPASAA